MSNLSQLLHQKVIEMRISISLEAMPLVHAAHIKEINVTSRFLFKKNCWTCRNAVDSFHSYSIGKRFIHHFMYLSLRFVGKWNTELVYMSVLSKFPFIVITLYDFAKSRFTCTGKRHTLIKTECLNFCQYFILIAS